MTGPGRSLHILEYGTVHISWAVLIPACMRNLPPALHGPVLLGFVALLRRATPGRRGTSGDPAHSASLLSALQNPLSKAGWSHSQVGIKSVATDCGSFYP